MSFGISNTYGQLRSEDGRTKLNPMIDNIDPSSIPDQMIAVKMKQSQIYEDKISINIDKKIPAIEELRVKVAGLETSIKKLTNDLRANYMGNDPNNPNALSSKIAPSSQNDGSFTLEIDPAAVVSKTEFNISVSQKAQNDVIEFSYNFSDMSTPVNFSGNIVINNQIISITDTSTLNTIINDINSKADISHVKASSLKISETAGYTLILENQNLAEPINFMGAAGTDSSLLGSQGLQLPTLMTDASTIENTTDQIRSGYTTTDVTAPLNFTGNLVINGQAISITSTSSLNSIMKSINSISNKTNVKATVESSDGTNYALILNGTQKGIPINLNGLTTSASLQGDAGLQLPTTNTDATSITTTTDHIVSAYITNDTTTALDFTGILLINNQAINITSTMSLNDIRDAINTSSDASHVVASIISSDSDDNKTFQLVLDGTEVGVPIDFQGTTTSAPLRGSSLGIPVTNTDRDSLIAKLSFKIGNKTSNIERNTNVISDIEPLKGVTLIIKKTSITDGKATGGTTFSIENDKTKALEAIKEFVENYNAVIDALDVHKKSNGQGEQTKPHEDALLYGENIINQIETLLQNITRLAIVGETNKDYTSLMDIGITIRGFDKESKKNDRHLFIDDKILGKKLDDDFNKIIKLFGNYAESSVPNFYVFSMQKELKNETAGKPINLIYTYNPATSTDESFEENFSVPDLMEPLGPLVAGQTVALTYTQNNDGTYSATLKGNNIRDKDNKLITDEAITTVSAEIKNNVLTFPSDSIYSGLIINYINTESPLAPGSSIETTLTLPQFSATLSIADKEPVTISNIQKGLIKAPKGSIYEGLRVGFNQTLKIGDSIKTILTLTQGIAVGFDNILNKALTKETSIVDKSGKSTPVVTGLFDIAIQNLVQQNITNQKQVDEFAKNAELIRRRYEPRMNSLSDTANKTKVIAQMLEAELASHYG